MHERNNALKILSKITQIYFTLFFKKWHNFTQNFDAVCGCIICFTQHFSQYELVIKTWIGTDMDSIVFDKLGLKQIEQSSLVYENSLPAIV
jgi:hypothetical protein